MDGNYNQRLIHINECGCESCSHKNVCIYRKDYDELIGVVKSNIPYDVSKEDIFSIEIKCKYYLSNYYGTISYKELNDYGRITIDNDKIKLCTGNKSTDYNYLKENCSSEN